MSFGEFSRADVEIASEHDVYRGFYNFRVVELRHRRFAGGWSETLRREVFVPRDAVGVLLYDPTRGSVILVEQFRVGTYREANPWALEIVAGIIEPNETPDDVAHRESLEEAGCEITQLLPIASYFSSPGNNTEQLHLFIGRIDSASVCRHAGLADEHEDIRVHVVSFSDAIDMLNRGVIINAHAIIALQWLQLNKDKVDKTWQ